MKTSPHKKLFFILGLFCVSIHAIPIAASEYKNRLSILPLENPPGWSAPYDPGALIAEMLNQSLSGRDKFQILPAPAEKKRETTPTPAVVQSSSAKTWSEKEKNGQADSAIRSGAGKTAALEEEISNHPAQFIVKGRVLHFTQGKPPSRAQIILNIGAAVKQRAEVEVELEFINHHLEKSLHKKRFNVVSSAGTVPFSLDSSSVDFNANEFQKSSVGKALLELNHEINAHVMATLYPLPLEGEIIAMDPGEKEIVVNIGQIHGVGFRDYFDVYSVTLRYKDPFSNLDLGNKFVRRGVIRIKDVQEGFSIASIIAGDGFAKGALVRSQKTNFTPPGENHAGQHAQPPWWNIAVEPAAHP